MSLCHQDSLVLLVWRMLTWMVLKTGGDKHCPHPCSITSSQSGRGQPQDHLPCSELHTQLLSPGPLLDNGGCVLAAVHDLSHTFSNLAWLRNLCIQSTVFTEHLLYPGSLLEPGQILVNKPDDVPVLIELTT